MLYHLFRFLGVILIGVFGLMLVGGVIAAIVCICTGEFAGIMGACGCAIFGGLLAALGFWLHEKAEDF